MTQQYQTPEDRKAILLIASQRYLRVRRARHSSEREWWSPRSPNALLKAATARAQALGWTDPISWLEDQLDVADFARVSQADEAARWTYDHDTDQVQGSPWLQD